MNRKFTASPSRQYVAPCYKQDFDGMYFRKFKLPEDQENSCARATWYFLNRLNSVACMQETCITLEDYNSLEDQDERNAESDRRMIEYYSRITSDEVSHG